MTHELGELHREDCASLVEDRCWACNCDGPTALADLRERLAAAIEAAAACYDEPNATVGEECYAQGLTDAARIVRERP
jgi:hypothetical protein